MEIYWSEQTIAHVPSDDGWLSATEALHLNGLRFPKRRADWRLGRWTAKCAVAAYLDAGGLALRHIEIRAAGSGAPEVFIAGEPAPVAISLSHSNGIGLCVVARVGAAVGCDLERIEPRSRAFVADYFAEEEQALVASASADDRSAVVSLLWSAKESALKALQEGLRLDTRSVIATLASPFAQRIHTWSALRVRCSSGQVFDGWWQRAGELVRTAVCAPAGGPPIELAIPQMHAAVTRRYA